jgi:aminoglycoside phosphotransferase (APT) family kinase protein
LSAIDTFDGDSVRSRLLAYLRGQVGGDVEIGPLKRYTVGFSWLTFGFNAKWSEGVARIERDLILRLGPPSGIFAPYRATPEFLTLQSLAGSGVPVPRAYWCCDDSDVLGAPFFVCEFVKGDAAINSSARSRPCTISTGAARRFPASTAPPIPRKRRFRRSPSGKSACGSGRRGAIPCSNGR